MPENFSEEQIHKEIAQIKHPFIDCSLIDLGMIKKVEINESKVKVIFALPFPNIPIKDSLINSVKNSIEKFGVELDTELTVMTQEELQNFLNLEKENWKT